jgi:cell fate (sporulation/competence/biofilm development) regulator YlbF (YheA/YmcA/DUF963 family)
VLFLSVEEKAKELAQAIKESPEYQELTSAQTRITLDPRAQEIVKQIQEERQNLMQAQMSGQQITQGMTQKLVALQKQAENNTTLNKLFKAQEEFNKVMESVNKTLTEELY